MSIVSFRPRLSSQPPSRLAINWDNPLTSGLVFSAYNAADDYKTPPFNYVTGIAGTASTDVGMANGLLGATPTFNGTTSGASAPLDLSSYPEVTFAFWLWWNAYSTNGAVCLSYALPAGGSFPNALYLQPNEALGNWGIFNYNANGSSFDRDTVARPSAQVWHHFAVIVQRFTGVALQVVMVDGVSVTITPGTHGFIGGTPFLRNGNLGVMGRTAIGQSTDAGRIANVNIWNRELSYTECKSIYYDSLQVLDPGLISVGVPSVGGGGAVAASRWFMAA